VRGDLLRWAREQQGFSSRYVEARGGPSRSYLSEVENGRKREVSSTVLACWVRILNVTEAFARGQLARYKDDPDLVAGLAAEIGAIVTSGGAAQPYWAGMSERERVREVLCLIAQQSKHLPRVVLAWVLDLQVTSADALLLGEYPVMPQHREAAAALTLLAESFFSHGMSAGYEPYIPVFLRALELGISPQELLLLIEAHTVQWAILRRARQPTT
jgi:transcriptional regulator with XRE-family HTH domain